MAIVPEHGTTARYQRPCRCDLCKKAWRDYNRLWAVKNRDKVIGYREKADQDKRREVKNAWRVNNLDKRRAYNSAYRARLRNAEGSHDPEEFDELKKRFGSRCVRCGIHESFFGLLERDHVVPLSRGGTDYISNIQPLCSKCNRRKGNRDSIDYRR